MMEQTVGDDCIKSPPFQGGRRQIPLLQRNTRLQTCLTNVALPKGQHRVRTIDTQRRDSGICLHESDRHVCRTASEIEQMSNCEVTEPLAKVSWNFPVRFRPICNWTFARSRMR